MLLILWPGHLIGLSLLYFFVVDFNFQHALDSNTKLSFWWYIDLLFLFHDHYGTSSIYTCTFEVGPNKSKSCGQNFVDRLCYLHIYHNLLMHLSQWRIKRKGVPYCKMFGEYYIEGKEIAKK